MLTPIIFIVWLLHLEVSAQRSAIITSNDSRSDSDTRTLGNELDKVKGSVQNPKLMSEKSIDNSMLNIESEVENFLTVIKSWASNDFEKSIVNETNAKDIYDKQ